MTSTSRAKHSPYKNKNAWKPSYGLQIENNLGRCLRGFEHYRAMDVDRAMCDRMRAEAGTEDMVRINTTTLRAFLLWGYQHGYFTALQAELLPRACSMPSPRLHRERARVDEDQVRTDRAPRNGQSERYIDEEDETR